MGAQMRSLGGSPWRPIGWSSAIEDGRGAGLSARRKLDARAARRAHRPDRPERRRQDDAAAHADRRDPAAVRARPCLGTNVQPGYYAQAHEQHEIPSGRAGGDPRRQPPERGGRAHLSGALPLLRRRRLQANWRAERRRAQPGGAGEADACTAPTSWCWTSRPTTSTSPLA